MDVKYVPKICYAGKDGEAFFQYTMIEEASRKRFIYAYKEQSSFSTVDFVKRAITFFGYAPQIVQTDNGGEFCHTSKTKRVHPLDLFCQENGITHKTIRPRTPWHNGKVERSHRNDHERFYNHLSFYSFDDLQLQMKRYLRRSNDIPMSVLGWKSPNARQRELCTRPKYLTQLGASPSLRQIFQRSFLSLFRSHIIDKWTSASSIQNRLHRLTKSPTTNSDSPIIVRKPLL